MINDIYYHGSKTVGITKLKINRVVDNPFGPAVYLTKDPVVADCYVRSSGVIYEVRIKGNMQFVINLDKSFRKQTTEAKEVITKTIKSLNMSFYDVTSYSIRELLHQNDCSKTEVNNNLARFGIWLLYGRLSAMEESGLMDRGVQYAVIEESALNIVNETDYYSIVAKNES